MDPFEIISIGTVIQKDLENLPVFWEYGEIYYVIFKITDKNLPISQVPVNYKTVR